MFAKGKNRFSGFTWKEWITFIIGLTLLITYIVVTLLEWHFRSNKVYKVFTEVQNQLDKTNILRDHPDWQKVIYPNATLIFWGGSTYWFTFMTNVLMGVTLFLFPFYRKSNRAQRFYFASMAYIIIVVAAYWSGVGLDPKIFTDSDKFEFSKTLIMHGVAPFLGLITLFWERKNIRISNKAVWSFSIYPMVYLLFTVAIYTFGHKFIKFGGTELDRGIVIYEVVSFLQPLGYKGGDTFLIVLFDIILVLMAFLSAPVIGFTLRKFFRILKPGQRKLKPIYFIHPTIKHEKEKQQKQKIKSKIELVKEEK
ncbi:hypothetical protein H9M94_01385 [Mycoplasma sp. Pen4]|uniref:MAGa3780 family membrane protein n=1 Tax=Mycoplasma sp. Pen4 TaxID=640330 RepID=UPI0016540255|nr:hypothetical protein [Mycoplasma sp. Pen4]QNM93909.1 hypothetical protein H9M94_01385 [Mycoplasma sp. Pen4]